MKKELKTIFVLLIALSICISVIMFTGCSDPKKALTGRWLLSTGEFMDNDSVAFEFKENGEICIYTGYSFDEEPEHGNYTTDGKLLKFIDYYDDYFGFQRSMTFNYSVKGDTLSIVSSSGTATFRRLDVDAEPQDFDERIIYDEHEQSYDYYSKKGYTVDDISLESQSKTVRIYRVETTASYNYCDSMIVWEDRYMYSPIREIWYLYSKDIIEEKENWHINGVWTLEDYGFDETIDIISFSENRIQFDYVENFHVWNRQDHYDGTADVWETTRSLQYGFEVSEDGKRFIIDKDKGICRSFGEVPFTYVEPRN